MQKIINRVCKIKFYFHDKFYTPGNDVTYYIVKSGNDSTNWILKSGNDSTNFHLPIELGKEVTNSTFKSGNESTTFTLVIYNDVTICMLPNISESPFLVGLPILF